MQTEITSQNDATANDQSNDEAKKDRPVFVLVHGAWHGAWAWSEMTTLLAHAGFSSIAVDLPGAGARTRLPNSFGHEIDEAQFETEVSPVAQVSQQDRTDCIIAAVQAASKIGNGRVILVGHSWGGITASHVAEAVPEKIQSVVYLSAYLLPNGMMSFELFGTPEFEASKGRIILLGDPRINAALRLNPRSSSETYRNQLGEVFYNDLPVEEHTPFLNMLHCDEPAGTAMTPMAITSDRYGSVDRHYILMEDDNAIPARAQDNMIAMIDRSDVGGKTRVHRMPGGHSPFFSRPDELAKTFVDIAKAG